MKDLFDLNVQWIKENTADAVSAVNSKLKVGVTPSLDASKITATVVDNCKIYYQSATDAKVAVENYLQKIRAISEMSAGQIGEDFFAK